MIDSTECGPDLSRLTVKNGRLVYKSSRVRNVAAKEDRQYNGVTYDSKSEARYAMELDLRLKAGDIRGWTRQVYMPLLVNGTVVCRMVIDFQIVHKDGRVEYVEIKGWSTPEYKLKRKLLAAVYPDLNYTVVKI